mgnify:FL=1
MNAILSRGTTKKLSDDELLESFLGTLPAAAGAPQVAPQGVPAPVTAPVVAPAPVIAPVPGQDRLATPAEEVAQGIMPTAPVQDINQTSPLDVAANLNQQAGQGIIQGAQDVVNWFLGDVMNAVPQFANPHDEPESVQN